MVKIKQKLNTAQDIKKSYAYKNKTIREFKVGEHVLFKVNTKRSSLKLGRCTNPTPRFYGPFEILDRIWSTAYMLALPSSMNFHNVFHFSLLKKYVHDPNHVVDWNLIHVDLEGDFLFQPVCILDKKVKVLQNQVIKLVKVQWTCYGPKDATWEHEDAMREDYP
jgi:hypothetical protein